MLCDLLGPVRAAAHRAMGSAAVAVVTVSIVACGSSASSPHSNPRPARPGSGTKPAVPTVLVLTQTIGYHHTSIPTAMATVRAIAARNGRCRMVFLASAAQLTPAALRHAAAVMFLLTTGELPIGGEKRALVAFVHGGGGLIGFHSATDTFHHWSAYKDMVGAEFSHHPHPSTQRVIVTDHSTPVTRALPASFPIHEEFYIFDHHPRPRVHVLAELDTGPRGPDRPLVWCRRFGRGRVYYDALATSPPHGATGTSVPSCRAGSYGRLAWPARRAARRPAPPTGTFSLANERRGELAFFCARARCARGARRCDPAKTDACLGWPHARQCFDRYVAGVRVGGRAARGSLPQMPDVQVVRWECQAPAPAPGQRLSAAPAILPVG